MAWLRCEAGCGIVHVLKDLDVPTIQWIDHFLRLGVQLYRIRHVVVIFAVRLGWQGLEPHILRIRHVSEICVHATVIAFQLQVTPIFIIVRDSIVPLLAVLVFVDDDLAASSIDCTACAKPSFGVRDHVHSVP